MKIGRRGFLKLSGTTAALAVSDVVLKNYKVYSEIKLEKPKSNYHATIVQADVKLPGESNYRSLAIYLYDDRTLYTANGSPISRKIYFKLGGPIVYKNKIMVHKTVYTKNVSKVINVYCEYPRFRDEL